jgi:copper oxidase (laccase) domain-containing protein
VHSWLGACIGPDSFEVGADVLAAFGENPSAPSLFRFKPGQGDSKWLANLALLARDRLTEAGVSSITGGGWCTVEDPSRFFSYRRDRVTGRMAAAVWLD